MSLTNAREGKGIWEGERDTIKGNGEGKGNMGRGKGHDDGKGER